MRRSKILFIIMLLVFSVSACASRLPKAKTAANSINHHFYKYGKKYKTSDFGQHKIEEVKVYDIEEIHKHLVSVTAEIKLYEGPLVTVKCNLQRKTFGWKFVSWEKL